jgi:hypothetical protein
MTRQPCCGNRTPHPTRFQARIGGPRYGGQYPWAHGLFPIGGVAPPCTDPSYARGQGFSPKASPLYHSLRSLGSLGPRGPAGAGFPATDTPCLFTGLSAGPVGHRQPGSFFPRLPAAGEGIAPYPAFGTDSRSIAAPTFPGRPTIIPGVPPGLDVDRDRAAASQPPRSPLSAGRAPIS